MQDSAYKKRSLFGRRQGRNLGDQRANALDTVLPKIALHDDKLNEDHTSHPSVFFERDFPSYWLEIGFGHGEHIAALFRKNTETGYIGAEPFLNGISSFLKDIENDNLDNIRVLKNDGMIAARSLEPNTLDGIYVLNPDPWHKKRHHKRRLINQSTLDIFAHILKPGGQLVMTTDVEDLAEWMCTQASHHPEFEWTANRKDDWQIPPQDWVKTRYEVKGAKGAKKMNYLFFNRKK